MIFLVKIILSRIIKMWIFGCCSVEWPDLKLYGWISNSILFRTPSSVWRTWVLHAMWIPCCRYGSTTLPSGRPSCAARNLCQVSWQQRQTSVRNHDWMDYCITSIFYRHLIFHYYHAPHDNVKITSFQLISCYVYSLVWACECANFK